MITKIISGGQTGADQGALEAARLCGVSTGGWAPKDFRTESGKNKDLWSIYGLKEHSSPNYAHWTLSNVQDSDATIVFMLKDSVGSKQTIDIARRGAKPCLVIRSPALCSNVLLVLKFILREKPEVVNIAGNWESVSPGIQQIVHAVIVDVVQIIHSFQGRDPKGQ